MTGVDATRGTASATALRDCPAPLVDRHDVLMLDLDGVVYVGPAAVPGAASALEKARTSGLTLTFVTNNASRTPEDVAAHLSALGVRAGPDEVVTSAQAAARLLAERLPAGATVLVVGTDALRREVRARGLGVVESAEERPAAVVQGHNPETCWRDLAEAAAAIHAGALWVATNRDTTLPSARGPMPGNGALVDAVRAAVGVEPLVAGKPEPTLQREAADRTGATRPLVVGDRLDTDIEGAVRSGFDSLLVLTGVTVPARLLVAAPARRPTFVATDLSGLLVPHPAPAAVAEGMWRCGGWTVRGGGSDDRPRLELDGRGENLDALRALCAAAWRQDDLRRAARPRPDRRAGAGDGGGPDALDAEVTPVVAAHGDEAAALLDRWGLT